MGLLNFIRKLLKRSEIKISSEIQYSKEIYSIPIKENNVELTPDELELLDWSHDKFENRPF